LSLWNTILPRFFKTTISSSFLCLSIIMVFFQWLMSKQLPLGCFHQIYIHY
jgi:hypothetical protein